MGAEEKLHQLADNLSPEQCRRVAQVAGDLAVDDSFVPGRRSETVRVFGMGAGPVPQDLVRTKHPITFQDVRRRYLESLPPERSLLETTD